MRVFYNRTLYMSLTLKDAADIYLRYLPPEINTLVSMGNSGCSIAAAMLVKSRRPLRHICFRKTDDERMLSHSSHSGNWLYEPDCRFAVVDDFICEGNTLDRIKDAMGLHWNKVEVILASYIECENRWGIPFIGIESGERIPPVEIPEAVTENVTVDTNCDTPKRGPFLEFTELSSNGPPLQLARELQGLSQFVQDNQLPLSIGGGYRGGKKEID